MIPLDSSVVLSPRLGQALGVRDVSPGSWDVLLSTEGCDWGPSGVQEDASTMSQGTSVMRELSILDWGASLSDASCYLTLSEVNTDVAFTTKDYTPAVPGLGSSFGASDNNPPFPSLAREPDCSRCTCLRPENCLGHVLPDALMGHVSHASYEVAAYPSSSSPSETSRTIHPYPLTSSLNQDKEENFETSGSDGFRSVDILHQYLDSAGPAAFLNEISSSDFAAWTDISLDFWEISQMVDFERLSAHIPLEQHLIVSEEAVHHCKWIDENGAICGGELSRSNLSGHLSTHGIKSMSRQDPTKCKWVGCRRKKPMNRESISRHVREVHLRVKRTPKQVQEPRS